MFLFKGGYYMKLTVDEKINHLRNLGISGDMSEIKKMYSGKNFNPSDKQYQTLINLSKKYCSRFTHLSGMISVSHSKEEIKVYTDEKSEILDILFPGHGPIFGGGDGLFAIIGMVDLDGFNYINARVHFNPSSLVHLEEYVFIASNVDFGTEVSDLNCYSRTPGTITVERDTWIGSNVKLENNILVSSRSVIGMGSTIVENSKLSPEMICFGNPCKEYKNIPENYQTTVKVPSDNGKRSKDEINYLLAHFKELGIEGDFSEYLKAINYEKYNTLEPTISKIYDLSHRLCSEYNFEFTTMRRKRQIINLLFPLHGENIHVGNDLFVDCIGTVKLGSNVLIGNHSSLAGNITIGDNVIIGNNVVLQTTGHEIFYKGRRLSFDEAGNMCEISTPGYIIIKSNVLINDGTLVIPNHTISKNTSKNEIIIHSN